MDRLEYLENYIQENGMPIDIRHGLPSDQVAWMEHIVKDVKTGKETVMEPVWQNGFFICQRCGGVIGESAVYCKKCGQKAKERA